MESFHFVKISDQQVSCTFSISLTSALVLLWDSDLKLLSTAACGCLGAGGLCSLSRLTCPLLQFSVCLFTDQGMG